MKEEIKRCPFCAEKILAMAQKCKYCGSDLNAHTKKDIKSISDKKSLSWKNPFILITISIAIIFFGTSHIVTGKNVFKIMERESFGFSEMFINVDALRGMTWIAAESQFPLSCRVLAREVKRNYSWNIKCGYDKIAMPKFFSQTDNTTKIKIDKAYTTKIKQDITRVSNALDIYRLNNGDYPSGDGGLSVLVSDYLPELLKDPWGNEYIYQNPGAHKEIDIYTLGKDNTTGGTGNNTDIGNW